MQLSAEWTRLSGFHPWEQLVSTVGRRVAARLVSTKVFRAPSEFVTLAAVTATYWLVSATVSSVLFPLVRAVHEAGTVRVGFAILSAVGVFVLINEPVGHLLIGHGPAIKAALGTLVGLLGLAAVGYWLDPAIFAAAIELATDRPFNSIAFVAGNLFLVCANVVLPVLGAVFMARLARRSLATRTAR